MITVSMCVFKSNKRRKQKYFEYSTIKLITGSKTTIMSTYSEVLVFQVRFLGDHPSLGHVSITCKLHDFEDCWANEHMSIQDHKNFFSKIGQT